MEYTEDELEQSIEETRHDIEEKRASMSEKLELLEERVRDTLEETRSAVEGIVENVKGTVDETVGAVKETVEGARSTVDTLVENVRGTMDETATMVKQSFDLHYQIEHRPWVMVGGAVLAGYLLGGWMGRTSSHRYSHARGADFSDNDLYTAPLKNGASFDDLEEGVDTHEKKKATNFYGVAGPTGLSTKGSKWSNVIGPFQEEWEALRGVALGTLMGTLRTMVRQNMPAVAPKLEQAINSASAKLGADPIDFPAEQDEHQKNNGPTQSHEAASAEGSNAVSSTPYVRPLGGQGSEPLAAKGSAPNQYK